MLFSALHDDDDDDIKKKKKNNKMVSLLFPSAVVSRADHRCNHGQNRKLWSKLTDESLKWKH